MLSFISKNKSVFFTNFAKILLLTTTFSAHANPFIHMAEKPYSEYYKDWIDFYDTHQPYLGNDTVEARQIISWMEEVAKKTGDIEWKFRAECYEIFVFGRHLNFQGKPVLINQIRELLTRIQKANIPPRLELQIRNSLANYYRYIYVDYVALFDEYAAIYSLAESASKEDVPEKERYFLFIGNIHYAFRDYQKAAFYYNKVLEDDRNELYSKQHARNTLGLIAGINKDYEQSNEWFRTLMHPDNFIEEPNLSEVWEGIAKGNIGDNMMAMGDYDEAIPLLKSCVEIMVRHGDFSFATGAATSLANIYLRKGHVVEAKRYIDLAKQYFEELSPDIHRVNYRRLSQIYEVLSFYYASIGNPKLSIVYADSTRWANENHEDVFNTVLLLHAEQKETALQREKFTKEEQRRLYMQRRLWIVSIAFAIICIMSVFLYLSYRNKQAAYRELVRKARQWAEVEETKIIDVNAVGTDYKSAPAEETATIAEADVNIRAKPNKTDLAVMSEIEQLMATEKIYRDVSLTVDKLAKQISRRSTSVSNAIKRCTNKNFHHFINEYRIKEAIQLLSQSGGDDKIEGIAYDCGFNDRITFYRVFKNLTGVAPSQFRRLQ